MVMPESAHSGTVGQMWHHLGHHRSDLVAIGRSPTRCRVWPPDMQTLLSRAMRAQCLCLWPTATSAKGVRAWHRRLRRTSLERPEQYKPITDRLCATSGVPPVLSFRFNLGKLGHTQVWPNQFEYGPNWPSLVKAGQAPGKYCRVWSKSTSFGPTVDHNDHMRAKRGHTPATGKRAASGRHIAKVWAAHKRRWTIAATEQLQS